MAWQPKPGTTTDGAVADLAAALGGLRPNAILDDVFAAPDLPPAEQSPPAELRLNTLLDDALGFGDGPGEDGRATAATPPPAPSPEEPPPADAYGFAPDAPEPAAFDPTATPTAPLLPRGGTYQLAPPPVPDAPIPLADGPPPAAQPQPAGYDVLPPADRPAGPNLPVGGPSAGQPPSTGGVSPGDVPRLVRLISDNVAKLVERAAKGGAAGAGAPTTPPGGSGGNAQPGYGLADASRPITDWFRGTRVGRIAETAYRRIGPAARAIGQSLGVRPGKGPKSPPRAPTGGPPPGGPPGASGAAAAGEAAAGSEAAAGAAAGAEGAAAGGAVTAGAAVPVAGAVIAATAALIELAGAGKDLAYEQEGRARDLGKYNANQAGSLAQLDVERVRRSMESGENTAASFQQLTEAINRMEDSSRSFRDLGDKIKNLVASGGLDVISELLKPLGPIADHLSELLDFWSGELPASETLQDQLEKIRRDHDRRREAARDAADAARRFAGP